MATVSETVLAALRLRLLSVSGARVERNIPVPTEVPEGGLIILRDGDPGEPEVTMSPLTYEYWHMAQVEIFVQARNQRDAKFDALKAAVGAAIAADRTISGTCLHSEAGAPQPNELTDDGAMAVKAASIPVTLVYLTSDPLA